MAAGSTYRTANTNQWIQNQLFVGNTSQPDLAATLNSYIQISQVAIVPDAVNSVRFQRPGGSIQGELALCQRYYEKTYDWDVNPGALTGVGAVGGSIQPTNPGAAVVHWSYKVNKRTTPTITIYNPTVGTTSSLRVGSLNEGAATFNLGSGSVAASAGGNFTAQTNAACAGHFTADAEL